MEAFDQHLAELENNFEACKIITSATSSPVRTTVPATSLTNTTSATTITTAAAPIAANTVVNNVTRQQLTVKEISILNLQNITRFGEQLKMAKCNGQHIIRNHYFRDNVSIQITYVLRKAGKINSMDSSLWEGWDDEVLITSLQEVFATSGPAFQTTEQKVQHELDRIVFNLDWKDVNKSSMDYYEKGLVILRTLGLVPHLGFDNSDTFPSMKYFHEVILENALAKLVLQKTTHHELLVRAIKAVKADKRYVEQQLTWSTFNFLLMDKLEIHKNIVEVLTDIGYIQPDDKHKSSTNKAKFNDRDRNGGSIGHESSENTAKYKKLKNDHGNDNRNSKPTPRCDGCGRKHPGGRDTCFMKNHADYNTEGIWEQSTIGKAYATSGLESLKESCTLRDGKVYKDGKVYTHKSYETKNSTNSSSRTKGPSGTYHKKTNSKCFLCSLNNPKTNNHTILTAYLNQNKASLKVRTLLGTGAERGCYISGNTARWLIKNGAIVKHSKKLICSCFGDCQYVYDCVNIVLCFKNVNKLSNNIISLPLNVWIIEKLPYDLIVGNEDIQNNKDLFDILFTFKPKVVKRKNTMDSTQTSVTSSESDGANDQPNLYHEVGHSEENKKQCLCNVHDEVTGSSGHDTSGQLAKVPSNDDSRPSELDNLVNINIEGNMISPSGVQPKPTTKSSTNTHISEVFDYEEDAWGIPDSWDSLDEYLNNNLMTVNDDNEDVLPTDIRGSPELIAKTKALLQEFKTVFRKSVSKEPAKIPAMEIKVDRQKWNNIKGNMGIPRMQGEVKNKEIKRQVDKLLEANVLQVSEANRYSQVHLQKKPSSTKEEVCWRFCIDFILLNSCCEGEGWNLPNIQQMLMRIGEQRPEIFAVMDLTSGYHQAPLSKTSQQFTAFITFFGILEWLRVPMGLKGAAGYFQKMLATVVLVSLIYNICELYIDDVIVPAKTEEEYLFRLRKVLERFQKHNITLNPKKCKFGLTSVEYVGHTIDSKGLSFSAEKLDAVLAIPPPEYSKELRSFLGLASYFRDHLDNYAIKAKPLQEMLSDYDKKKKLIWTPEGKQAFEDVKDSIRKCPKLFFMNDDAPIFLHTDASDYGIGAYLFQVIDGKEYPIQFMSKTLTAEEIKWSTIEKECYAIVYALHKFEYLLRDKHFTLRTDHANLKYLNNPPSAKVRRWKISIQGYDMDLEWFDGKKNQVADGFSRLLDLTPEIISVIKGLKIPDEQYKLISSVHNSTVGHHGVDRTIAKLTAQNLEWKGIRDHVRKFIDNCPCQKMNNNRIAIHTHPFTLSNHRPMEVLHIDTLSMGIANDNDESYLLVLIDSCSRWIELFPIRDLTAEVAAKKLLEHIARFGHPSQILSDNGPQFVNKLLEELFILTGIDKRNTTPYSHEENGIVERSNKEILRHVRSILFDRGLHKEWNEVIPNVQRILNSQKSSVTGCTPAELVLINSNNLENGIYLNPIPSSVNTETLSEFHSKRIALYNKSLEVARQKMQEMEEEKILSASTERTEYKVGSYVLLRAPDEDIIKSKVGKLKLPLKGPMLVLGFKKDQYIIQDITNDKEYKVHIKRLVPFYYDESIYDPYEIAAKDIDEELVDKILDHVPNPPDRKKSKMQFLVRWAGQDKSHDLWLPWKELYSNTILHKYLNDNGMKTLIPTKYRKPEYK